MNFDAKSMDLAKIVANRLRATGNRLVLAESCTAGLIAATLGRVSGISQSLCGSAVVYRDETKITWLGVAPDRLAEETSVSQFASREIARGVLEKTPEATVSLGITGHLGPEAPAEVDGRVFVSLHTKRDLELLESESADYRLVATERIERQSEAVKIALELLAHSLSG